MRALPHSVLSLIEELEADYPPKCKSPEESLETHAHYAGSVSLVSLLRARYDAESRREKKGLPKVLS
jgi:hypothetical protein